MHGGQARVIKNQRDAEIGKGPDKNDGATSKKTGLDEGEGYFAETALARTAEVGRGFVHGGVEIGEGGNRVEINNRVKAEGINERDAEKLVGG